MVVPLAQTQKGIDKRLFVVSALRLRLRMEFDMYGLSVACFVHYFVVCYFMISRETEENRGIFRGSFLGIGRWYSRIDSRRVL